MSNIEYWRESLGNAIPDKIFTDKEIENIISIAEMESEYCSSHEFHKAPKTKITEDPVVKLYSTCCNGVVVYVKGSYMGQQLPVCDRCRKYLSNNQIKSTNE